MSAATDLKTKMAVDTPSTDELTRLANSFPATIEEDRLIWKRYSVEYGSCQPPEEFETEKVMWLGQMRFENGSKPLFGPDDVRVPETPTNKEEEEEEEEEETEQYDADDLTTPKKGKEAQAEANEKRRRCPSPPKREGGGVHVSRKRGQTVRTLNLDEHADSKPGGDKWKWLTESNGKWVQDDIQQFCAKVGITTPAVVNNTQH